jgi:hypothetical protein
VEELFNSEAQRLVSDYPDAESWEEGFVASGRFILENRQAVYHLYNSVHRDELKRYIGKIAEQVMTRFIGRISSELTPAPDSEDVQIISGFYINALTGFVWDWLDNGMKADPEQMIRRLGYLFDGSIRMALEKSSENRDLHKS